MPRSRQLWSLMMSFFISRFQNAKKKPKMPKWSKCQDAKKDAKMPKGQEMPVPLKKMPTIARCQNQRNQGDI